ncbi:Hypothetical protein PENO1_103550 [Penicillium occitanis (nom. inval.)]|nr:Hypothetical protein PENO1_103550 [Penicillium occitanis (nom. inval.)]PCG91013.1 hypothetical protein PENOC_099330 [Penicillium occitanis (nom. inval.)]
MFNFRADSQSSRRSSGSDECTSEQETFLHYGEFKTEPSVSKNAAIPWMASTFILGVCLLVVLFMDYPLLRRESYESGYSTEMQAAINEIEIEEVRFWGGIKADENGTFYMHFNPDEKVRYVVRPYNTVFIVSYVFAVDIKKI